MPGGIVAKGTFPNKIDEYTSEFSRGALSCLIFGRPSAQMIRLRQGQSSPSIRTMIALEALTGKTIQELYGPYWETEKERWEKVFEEVRG